MPTDKFMQLCECTLTLAVSLDFKRLVRVINVRFGNIRIVSFICD